MDTRFLLTSLVVGLAAVALPRVASAQNQDPYFFGDEAALASGAVVASVRDSGSLWYNPAGFGGSRRSTVSASASTFGIRIRRIPRALRVQVGGQEHAVDLSAADVLSVPNAVVAGTALTDQISIAGGLLTTERDLGSALVTMAPAGVVNAQGTPATLGERLDLQTDSAKYHFGGALGIELTERLRLGVSLFGTYAKTTESVQYAFHIESAEAGSDERALLVTNARVTNTSVGVAGAAGLQWDAGPVSLGLTVRSPEVVLTASSEGGAVTALASAGGTDPAQARYEEAAAPEKRAGGSVIVPARALFGIGVPLAKGSWVELDVDGAHGLPETPVSRAKQPVVNGRIGARIMVTPSWIVGGGVFTDRAVERKLRDFVTSSRVDWYGLTAGVSKRTLLSLVKDPSPEALVLVTTLSLRAGVGFGQARAITIDLDAPPDAPPRDDRSDVVFFEVMPYLGSSVVF